MISIIGKHQKWPVSYITWLRSGLHAYISVNTSAFLISSNFSFIRSPSISEQQMTRTFFRETMSPAARLITWFKGRSQANLLCTVKSRFWLAHCYTVYGCHGKRCYTHWSFPHYKGGDCSIEAIAMNQRIAGFKRGQKWWSLFFFYWMLWYLL